MTPSSKSKFVNFSLSKSSFLASSSLKELAYKQNGQRTRLKNNNAEMGRLIQEIQDFGKVVVSGSKVRLDDWLVGGKRSRHAEVPPTQGSDGLSQSQSSSATSEGPSQPTDELWGCLGQGHFQDQSFHLSKAHGSQYLESHFVQSL